MSTILNLRKPHRKLDEVPEGADFIEQGGIVYGWSESNCQYERAWWLYPDAPACPLTEVLRRERPAHGAALAVLNGTHP